MSKRLNKWTKCPFQTEIGDSITGSVNGYGGCKWCSIDFNTNTLKRLHTTTNRKKNLQNGKKLSMCCDMNRWVELNQTELYCIARVWMFMW